MDARELTMKYNRLENEVIKLKRKVEFLEQCISKLQMHLGDHICMNLMQSYEDGGMHE